MNKRKIIRRITKRLDHRALLEGLAEEASELSQAALKYIRAAQLSNNATPTTIEEAKTALQEELTDVLNYCELLGLEPLPEEKALEKLKRCSKRLKKAQKGEQNV